jgi:hypothetical protein
MSIGIDYDKTFPDSDAHVARQRMARGARRCRRCAGGGKLDSADGVTVARLGHPLELYREAGAERE